VITDLLVLVLGGCGAIARYLVDGAVQRRNRTELPLGTLLVNLCGCFVLGLLSGVSASAQTTLLLGTATIGSFTTFSTWMLETHRPAEDGEPSLAWRNVVVSLIAGLLFAFLGRSLGRAL
jgi:CrcB protein